jgi:hypothetical protein
VRTIHQRNVYFGRWIERKNGRLVCLPDGGNWRAALVDYNSRINGLMAGRLPRQHTSDSDGLRVSQLCNRLLTTKTRCVEPGELTCRSPKQCGGATDMLFEVFGGNRLVCGVADVMP